MLKYTSQNELYISKSSSSLKEVNFGEQKFLTSKSISNIKYYYTSFQNNNLFYLFNNQLDYILTNHFAEFETTKNNIDRFLSNALMALFTKKLFY